MTREEADREAKRRWGSYVSAEEGTGPGMQGIVTIEKRSAPMIRELGRGQSWEEALLCAEHAVWRESHPFNLTWREREGLLFLRAECDRCRLVTEHKVRKTSAAGADWLARAQNAEQAVQQRVRLDGYWRKCSHKTNDVRPEREHLERLVQRHEPSQEA